MIGRNDDVPLRWGLACILYISFIFLFEDFLGHFLPWSAVLLLPSVPISIILPFFLAQTLRTLGLPLNKKAKKAADMTGFMIAKQIELALRAKHSVALSNLPSVFLVGYIFEFARSSFTNQGLESGLADRFIEHITKKTTGIDLYPLMKHQLINLDYAQKFSVRDQLNEFDLGSLYGAFDGRNVNYEAENIYRSLENRSLYRYLKNESLPMLPHT